MRKSSDYYANRLSHLAMTDPSVDVTDDDVYKQYIQTKCDELCLDFEQVWESVQRFHDVSGDFYRANSRLR